MSQRVQSGSEGVRGPSQDLRKTEGPARVCGSQRVQSGSEGIRASRQDLRESEGSVRF